MRGALSKEVEKSQQNELELVLELVGDFFGRKKCVGAGISGGGHCGPTRQGARPGGGRALDPRGQVLAPSTVFSVPNILKYSKKIIFHFQGIWRTFIFGVFLYCTDNPENRQENAIFTLFQLNNRK